MPDLDDAPLTLQRTRTCLTGTMYEHLLPFARDILGYDRIVVQPHAEMCEFLEQSVEPLFYEGRPPSRLRSMLAAPRGTFKTTLGVTALPLWLIVQFPNIRILLDTHTNKFSKQILYDIKWHMEYNEKFKTLFGELAMDAGKWAEDSIIVNTRKIARKEGTIDIGAVDSPKTGGHYDVVLVDDLLNEKTAFTATGLLKSKRHVNTLTPILENNGVEIFTFTRWAYNDCYGKLLDDEAKAIKAAVELAKKNGEDTEEAARKAQMYRKMIRGAWNKDGSLYAPTILPESTLQQLRNELTDKEFAVWYLNEPIEDGSKVFPKSLLRYWHGSYTFEAQPFIELEVS